MTDLGADSDYQGLRYFEMMPEQTRALVEKGKERERERRDEDGNQQGVVHPYGAA